MTTAQQSTINPVFAGHAAQQLREATDDLQRVFDNLFEIADGKDHNANTYDRLRATRVLYDRGFGKVTQEHTPHAPSLESSRSPKSEKSNNQTNHSSDTNRPVARLEQKLHDTLGPPQAPAEPEDEDPPIRLDAVLQCATRQSSCYNTPTTGRSILWMRDR